ncbi:MAG TPA: 7-cyano-7-deazaguanine synthase QueC [Fibrobacteria bacterium]|nr:7-cyano-7-deazaguanine synthase QueC [Fibrobacteria bacterium]
MSVPHHKSRLNRTALVVFSGGQDSTTCLHWALRTFSAVETVFFDYGQRHACEERAAQVITWKLGVPLRRFKVDFFRELGGNSLTDAAMDIDAAGESALPNTFVPGRNLLFLTQAAAYAYTRGIRDVVTGVCQTDYSGYPDCRHDTIRALQRSLHLGLGWPERHRSADGRSGRGGAFRIHTPLMFRTKAGSVALAQRWGALDSLAFSHTCYEGAFPPCGRCPACVLRAKGFAEAGIADPLITRAAAERAAAPSPAPDHASGDAGTHAPITPPTS